MNCEKKQRAYITYMKAACGEYAKEISRSLFEMGYGVFYDKKSLRSGEFDINLYLAINNSEWFIILLDKHIFEGWNDEKNWVHREVAHALEEKKKIIVIKTPGLDLEKEIPEELRGKLFGSESSVIELDTKDPAKTALIIRDRFEENGGVSRFEKSVNRIFSGIYLWRIAVFPILGALLMLSHLSKFYGMYLSNSYFEVGYIFKHFGTATVYTFNLFYIILGTVLCGVLMYITRKKLRLDIIPLFLADVAGVVMLSMLARKVTDTIFGLGNAAYWANPMGEAVWFLSEQTAVYMVVITLVVQMLMYLFKRSKDFV